MDWRCALYSARVSWAGLRWSKLYEKRHKKSDTCRMHKQNLEGIEFRKSKRTRLGGFFIIILDPPQWFIFTSRRKEQVLLLRTIRRCRLFSKLHEKHETRYHSNGSIRREFANFIFCEYDYESHCIRGSKTILEFLHITSASALKINQFCENNNEYSALIEALAKFNSKYFSHYRSSWDSSIFWLFFTFTEGKWWYEIRNNQFYFNFFSQSSQFTRFLQIRRLTLPTMVSDSKMKRISLIFDNVWIQQPIASPFIAKFHCWRCRRQVLMTKQPRLSFVQSPQSQLHFI